MTLVVVDEDVGSGFRYAGGGYVLVQLLLQDVTGVPFTELAADRGIPSGPVASTGGEASPLFERLVSIAEDRFRRRR